MAAAIVVGCSFASVQPAHAASATTLALQGDITVGSGLASRAGLVVSGRCAGGTVSTQVGASAGVCSVSSDGWASGDCTTWSGVVSGSVADVFGVPGAAPGYSIQLVILTVGTAVELTGTAVDPSGAVKTVAGTGVAVMTRAAGCTSNSDGTIYTFTGSLTIFG